jgi:hypothetical protein
MIPISGGPFGSNLGGTVWSRDEGAEGAEADEEGLKSIQQTTKRLVRVARKLKVE